MGWVITQFPARLSLTCDATHYHSPLVLNISRPDRSTFCFKITSKLPDAPAIKYTCQQPPSAGQVGRVQVLTAPGCGAAVAAITVDGRPWTNYTYDSGSSILSIERIATVPPPDAANPADRTVCVILKPIPTSDNDDGNANTCGSLTSFCAPAYGPDPACAVLVADNKANCCPVNRVSYADAEVEGGLLYRLSGKFMAGCESVTNETELQTAIARQYRAALGLPSGSIQFLSYSCQAGRLTVVFRASSMTVDKPDQIAQRSAILLKSLASQVGLVGVRASPYTAPPPPQLPPSLPPPQLPSPPPKVPSSPPPTQPSSPSVSPPQVPSQPNMPARLSPSPSHYTSQPPPVYGTH
ncbi:hypothetical protein PLESTF_001526400 [Pleodorina starrii]|nr:hypothetical protein PLESTF_001526400 [Pleodorina starrii]